MSKRLTPKAQFGTFVPKPVYDNIPSPNRLRIKAENDQMALANAKKATEAARAAAIEQATMNPATISKTEPKRSAASKAWAIAAHPLTALQYKTQGKDIPDHFDRGNENVLDYAISVVNPVFWADELQKFTHGVGDVVSNPGNQTLGTIGQTALHGLGAFPLMSEVAGLSAKLAPVIKQGATTFTKTADLPIGKRLSNAINAASLKIPVEGDVSSHSYFRMTPDEVKDAMNTEMKNLPEGAFSMDKNMSKNSAPLYWTNAARSPKDFTFVRTGNEQMLNWSGTHGKRVANALPSYAKEYLPQVAKEQARLDEYLTQLKQLGTPEALEKVKDLEKKGVVSNVIGKLPGWAAEDDRAVKVLNEFMKNYKPTLDAPIQQVNQKTGLNFPMTRIAKDEYSVVPDYLQPTIVGVKGNPLNRYPKMFANYGKDKMDQLRNLLNFNSPHNATTYLPEFQDEMNWLGEEAGPNLHKKGGPIVDPRGQWAHPGKKTVVPTPNGHITMQGVPYPVYGQDETGHGQMMMPGGEYMFPGTMVYETPMKTGGYIGYDGQFHEATTPTWSGNTGYKSGGTFSGNMFYREGGIHIKPSHEGKFTAWAKAHGYSMSEAIKAGKNSDSPSVRKMATFAANARKWKHQNGGPVVGDEMDVTPEQLEQLRQQGYDFEII